VISGNGARVLVVEDDATLAEVVGIYLARTGLTVEHAGDGERALLAYAQNPPDLVVLDLMLPGVDGREVCRRLRAAGPVPVIILTALGSVGDRVLGLELGADDYVTKPFSPRELALRVQAVLRRTGPAARQAPLVDGDLDLDVVARTARRGGRDLPMTAREFDLLAFLLRHPGQAFTRDELLRRVWGWTVGGHATVTSHVRHLREKVEDQPSRPERLVTVWGVGYRWEPARRA
jgi:DNA-binding response OmpR family regulator